MLEYPVLAVVYAVLIIFLVETLSTPRDKLKISRKYGPAKETHRPS